MEINVQVKKKVTYWGWGTGGVEIVDFGQGAYPREVPVKVYGQMNNPQPHLVGKGHHDLTYSGWVEKDTNVYWYLRKFEGENKLVLTKQDVEVMLRAYCTLHGLDPKRQKFAVYISEIAFYDANMEFLYYVRVNVVLSREFEQYELHFDFRTPEEIAGINAR